MAGFDVQTDFYPQAQPNALLGATQGYLGVAQQALAARQAKQDLVKGQVDYLANGLGALASKADLSPQDMIGFGQRAVQEGILDPQTFQTEMQQVSAAGSDPAKLRALATQYQLRALDAGQKFSAQFGTPGTIDNGDLIQPVTTSPLTGIHPMGPPIQKTLSPSELAAPAVVSRNGVPTAGTQGQALVAAGVNPLTAMPDTAAPAGNALTGATAPAPATAAAATTPIDTGNPMASQAPGAAPAGPTFAPLSVGETEAAQKTGAASGDALAADRAFVSNYQANVLPIEQAIAHIDQLGNNATGPGLEDVNAIQSFLQAMGIPVVDPQKVANFDELKKYLVQLGRTNGNTGTNDQLAAALSGSPGTTVSTLANKDILRTLQGMSRLRAAQELSFEQSGLPQSQYGQWAAQFNSSADPRAFAFDLVPADQRAALVQGMTADQRAKFVKSLRVAVELGLVAPPNG